MFNILYLKYLHSLIQKCVSSVWQRHGGEESQGGLKDDCKHSELEVNRRGSCFKCRLPCQRFWLQLLVHGLHKVLPWCCGTFDPGSLEIVALRYCENHRFYRKLLILSAHACCGLGSIDSPMTVVLLGPGSSESSRVLWLCMLCPGLHHFNSILCLGVLNLRSRGTP